LDHLVYKALSSHTALGACFRPCICPEDDEPLFAPGIQGHEHVHSCLLLHAAQLTAAISSDPALAVVREVHLRCIIPVRNVWNGHAATALLQKPADELLATPPLLL